MAEADFSINRYGLDEEWLNQPELYHYWATEMADRQLAFDESKSRLDVVRAELDSEIRNNPEDYGIRKLSEEAVKNAILKEPEYKKAIQDFNNMRHELEICKAAVNALEHRKRALTMLVELWIRDYYSDPKANTEADSDWEKKSVRTRGLERRRESREKPKND